MEYINAFFNTPGIGGLVAGTAVATLVTCYALTVRWISRGHESDTEKH